MTVLNLDYKNEKFFTSYVFHYVLRLWYRTVIAIHIKQLQRNEIVLGILCLSL